jgi:SAM-dependent methyltransferase
MHRGERRNGVPGIALDGMTACCEPLPVLPFRTLLVVALFLALRPSPTVAETRTDSTVLALRQEARALAPHVRTPLARALLAATAALPPPPTRTVYFDSSRAACYTESEAQALSDSARSRLARRVLDGRYYYRGRYGSPLNYVRAIEVAGQAGLESLEGKRVLDFGYGRAGHLRLLASMGADVVGIDVDPILRALYAEPGDQGPVPGFKGRGGTLRLLDGSFPADSSIWAAVGGDYDLILSKNTLKGGHELSQRIRETGIVNLGVMDPVFVREIYARLKPGGWFLIYVLSSPQGNGGCPFPEPMLRAEGFEVLAYDADDSPGAHAMRRAQSHLWDPAAVDSGPTLIGTYTLARRPAHSR